MSDAPDTPSLPRTLYGSLIITYIILALLEPAAPFAVFTRIVALILPVAIGVALFRSSRSIKEHSRIRIDRKGTPEQRAAAKDLLRKADGYENSRAVALALALAILSLLVFQLIAAVRVGVSFIPAVALAVCSLVLLRLSRLVVEREQEALTDGIERITGAPSTPLGYGELDMGVGYRFVASNYSNLPSDPSDWVERR